ncbi:MAG: SDR family oxidoreductase [Planctomycetota bacterium]
MTASKKVALVTGSTRGLGLAVARRLAADGWRVHVVWRSGDSAPQELARDFGERVHRADLVEAGSGAALVARVLDIDGRLDGLVHAVGDYHEGDLATTGRDRLEHLLANNVATAIEVLDAAREHLRDARGAAVLFGVAGLAGLRARKECAAYAAAKSALLVLARSWAVEEARHGVRVNVVSPGIVPHDGAHPATLDRELHARIPQGRPGRPEEVAATAAWLLSAEASHVTGADVPVAGGWML